MGRGAEIARRWIAVDPAHQDWRTGRDNANVRTARDLGPSCPRRSASAQLRLRSDSFSLSLSSSLLLNSGLRSYDRLCCPKQPTTAPFPLLFNRLSLKVCGGAGAFELGSVRRLLCRTLRALRSSAFLACFRVSFPLGLMQSATKMTGDISYPIFGSRPGPSTRPAISEPSGFCMPLYAIQPRAVANLTGFPCIHGLGSNGAMHYRCESRFPRFASGILQ